MNNTLTFKRLHCNSVSPLIVILLFWLCKSTWIFRFLGTSIVVTHKLVMSLLNCVFVTGNTVRRPDRLFGDSYLVRCDPQVATFRFPTPTSVWKSRSVNLAQVMSDLRGPIRMLWHPARTHCAYINHMTISPLITLTVLEMSGALATLKWYNTAVIH